MRALRVMVSIVVLAAGRSDALGEVRKGEVRKGEVRTGEIRTGEIRTAATCALEDVQAVIDASRAGDTVRLPAGTATWKGSLTIEKGIHLQGAGAGGFRGSSRTSLEIGTGIKDFATQAGLDLEAGQSVRALYIADGSRFMEGTVTAYGGTSLQLDVVRAGGRGTYGAWVLAVPAATVLVNDAANDWNRAMVDIFEDPDASAEVSGIRFKTGTATFGEHLNVHGRAGGKPVLIHDCWFTHDGNIGRGIMVYVNRGIVYRCSFDGGLEAGVPQFVHTGITIKLGDEGNRSWSTPDTMGAKDATGLNNFYVEDTYFAGAQAFDLDDNSRTVVRRCVFNNSNVATHGAETSQHGLRHFELYDNEFLFDDLGEETLNLGRWIWIRGGTGVIADNAMPDIKSRMWGDCTEIVMIVMSLRRKCLHAGHPYPVPRQVGQGHDGDGYLRDPLYIWNNSCDPRIGTNDHEPDEVGRDLRSADYLREGRDYIAGTARPGYAKYAYPHPLRKAAAPPVKAFPTAEGFGAGAVGGRGGRVIEVTTLEDSGPGSLRAAMEESGPRIVVFRVSGTITLKGAIRVSAPYLTVAGQTSPGGVQIRGDGKPEGDWGVWCVNGAHDIVLRHLRVRMGGGMKHDAGNNLLFYGTAEPGVRDAIVDHCSVSWGSDTQLDWYGSYLDRATFQWNLIGECSMGQHIGGNRAPKDISLHHNLYANLGSRTPLMQHADVFDFRNNVIYNWSGNNASVFGQFALDSSAFGNVVDNLWIAGPEGGYPYLNVGNGGPVRIDGKPADAGGTKLYLSGNRGPRSPNGSPNDWTGHGVNTWDYYERDHDGSTRLVDQAQYDAGKPFPAPPVRLDPVADLLDKVLPAVGACRPSRDAVDARIVQSVRDGTGTSRVDTTGPWPDLATGAPAPPADSDHDGMPDAWEKAHGLDPENASDGAAIAANGYTNVENYLNELAGDPIPGSDEASMTRPAR